MGADIRPADSICGYAVLVVDPDDDARAVMTAILRYCGALVWDVASTEAALTVMREALPNAVVATLRPSPSAATALVRRLRALPIEEGGKTPVIGVGPSMDAAGARASGVDAYLETPIDPWALCRLISELVG